MVHVSTNLAPTIVTVQQASRDRTADLVRKLFSLVVFLLVLNSTLFRPGVCFGVLYKQCRPSSDAAKCGV